ncbi:Hint domain-containing protein [Nereida sp. MMG025]|uniref:Hint domain-containing protein n=1 Tax=Nereida sp. MMG025 TaxID=2909981 RepID=UPI00351CBEBF
MANLNAGASWAWHGEAVRVDGPNDILLLEQSEGQADLHRRAARMVQRLVGAALAPIAADHDRGDVDDLGALTSTFTLTDGSQRFLASMIHVGAGKPPLLMFVNELPPRDLDLWVVTSNLSPNPVHRTGDDTGGVICFTPGTLIETEVGEVPVELLTEGDRILTKDNGPQPIVWRGHRRMTGARLFAMPHLRPVRIKANALAEDVPDADLLVSPEHQIVLRGQTAKRLFNETEVLVAAKELTNGRTIITDHAVREVTYIHLMLEQHQVLWANGIETESFHPSNTSLDMVAEDQRDALFERFPHLRDTPDSYGAFARRSLSRSDVAILAHDSREQVARRSFG